MRLDNEMEWDDETTTKFACLLREKKILWCKKYNESNKRSMQEAFQYINARMKLPNITITPSIIAEKMNHLLKLYSLEIRKITNDPRYKPSKPWFPILHDTFENQNEKGGNGNNNISEVGYSNHSASKFSTGTESGTNAVFFDDDSPTQKNISINRESVGHGTSSDNAPSKSLPREDEYFTPAEPSLAERYDESSNSFDCPSSRLDEILVTFGNYLVSLLKRLPMDRSNQLQLKFISETMNITTHNETDCNQLPRKRKNGVNHDRKDDATNNLDFPSSGHEDVLVTFKNYLVSLLKRLPIDKSNQLQEKFISHTMNETTQYEMERYQLLKKRKSGVKHDRQSHSTLKEPRLDHARFNVVPKEGVINKINFSSSSNQIDETQQQKKLCNSVRNNGIAGESRSIPEMTVEEGPLVEEIKEELDIPDSELPNLDSTVSAVSKRYNNAFGKNRVECVQCPVCKELFLTMEELERHNAVKHSGGEEITLKRSASNSSYQDIWM